MNFILWGSNNFTFSFVYDDDSPVEIDLLYLTFYDIDGPQYGTEEIHLYGIDSYIVEPSHPFIEIEFGNDWVNAVNNGGVSDEPNVNSLADMTEKQKQVSVTGIWRNINHFKATLSVNAYANSARFFIFARPR